MALLRLVKNGSGQVVSASQKLEMLQRKYLPTPFVFILLDCSGSMAGDKLRQAKEGVAEFTKKAKGKVGLIVFSNQAHLVDTISNTTAGGSTNMVAAIKVAMENMPKSGIKRTIVIATDGEPDNPAKTLKIASSAKQGGIKIICIGTDDADEGFLKKLSSQEDLGMKVSRKNFGRAIANSATLLLSS